MGKEVAEVDGVEGKIEGFQNGVGLQTSACVCQEKAGV